MLPTVSRKARVWVAGALAGLAVGVIGCVLAVIRPEALERSELWTYDVRTRAAAVARKPHSNIVLVEISELDIANVDDNLSLAWPWPRSLFGYIASYCKKAGARVIAYDFLFQERGQFSVGDAEEFATALREAANTVIGLALTNDPLVERKRGGNWAALLREFPTRDEAMTAAIRLQSFSERPFVIGNAVWWGGASSKEDLEARWQRLQLPQNARSLVAPDVADEETAPSPKVMRELTPAELAQELSIAAVLAEREGVPGDGNVPSREGIDAPLGVIAVAPARLGHVHQTPDVDGVIRDHAPLVKHAGRLFPSLPVAAYLVAHPGTKYSVDGKHFVLGDKRFELDDRGRLAIRFLPANSVRRISSYKILQSASLVDEGKPPVVPFEDLKDAYVIVAASAHGLRDLRHTPVSETQLGAEVNANLLDNLEQGITVVRTSPISDGAITLLLCLVTAVAVTALSRAFKRVLISLPVTLAATAMIAIGYVLVARWLLASHDKWVAVAIPAAASAVSAFVTLLVLSAVERQNRRFVQEALGRYTSPALVQELIEHPEYLSLEWGEERPMSVYFSDIAGFTTISEHLEAKELVTLLNEYLTEMTDLVLAHGGVVDKYIGDAVMAFWGAPLRDPDHAKHAVACAIAMRKRCDELRDDWQKRFGQAVYARAGVNSGEAVVGNMGSKHKYNYTVMGDMVNLAARLEGANKPYGTYLMISESTAQALGGSVDLRELDLVAVKGKQKPVKVFEVLDVSGQTTPEMLEIAKQFEAGLALYRAQKFGEAKAIFQSLGTDPPSKMYVERCEHFEAQPPGEAWDGVWHMKEK